MFGSFGWMELMLVLIIVLIIFGAGKIPQLGEGLGKAIKGFKKSVNEPDALDVTASTQEGTPSAHPPDGTPQHLTQPREPAQGQPQSTAAGREARG
jgi:sec-independent protein translocase protein TatA